MEKIWNREKHLKRNFIVSSEDKFKFRKEKNSCQWRWISQWNRYVLKKFPVFLIRYFSNVTTQFYYRILVYWQNFSILFMGKNHVHKNLWNKKWNLLTNKSDITCDIFASRRMKEIVNKYYSFVSYSIRWKQVLLKYWFITIENLVDIILI